MRRRIALIAIGVGLSILTMGADGACDHTGRRGPQLNPSPSPVPSSSEFFGSAPPADGKG